MMTANGFAWEVFCLAAALVVLLLVLCPKD